MNIWDDTPETAPKIKSKLPSKNAAKRAMRSSSEYKQAREQFKFQAEHHRNRDGTIGEPCWLCGEPVDYRLKFPHPRSWSLDHAVPIKDSPALMLNPRNFRSSHFDCNNHRSPTSRPSTWVSRRRSGDHGPC